ncbi:hypothetical protein AX14_002201 [Amanita brunnescens Koide BX004]|nr:hypothetical protein AX14_002201 [Amanita brunnescens Koide BX004]
MGDIDLYNLYNDAKNDDATSAMADAMQIHKAQEEDRHTIWLGDFNRHHPFWDKERNVHLFTKTNLERAQVILDLVAEHSMEMALPKDIPTLRALSTRNLTRPDNVFISSSLIDALIYCNTEPDWQPVKTDHFPIITKLTMSVMANEGPDRLNYREVDWGEFRKKLKENLRDVPKHKQITSRSIFDVTLQGLNDAIARTTEAVIPKVKHTPQEKDITRKGRKAHNQHFNPDHPDHGEYRMACNLYAMAINEAKARHWNEWLESLDENSVWIAGKYACNAPSDAGRAKVPDLNTLFRDSKQEVVVTTSEGKGRAFYEAFFPPKPEQHDNHLDQTYPPPRWKAAPIKDKQLKRAIDKMLPYKATAPGTTPNCVLKEAKDLLIPYLGPLFRATFHLEYYPSEWAKTLTVVLKKPGKPNYEIPNAWRPISLSNGFAHLLNACIADDLLTRCEQHKILPKNHFGARPGHSTTHAIHYLVTKVKDAWRKKKVVTALFLDVKGAFPSVYISRLRHDMRLRGIPKETTDWIARQMEHRQTNLNFDDYTSEPFNVDNGLDQGNPFSAQDSEDSILFVDNTTILAVGTDYIETHGKISSMLHREGGILQWAEEHNCSFGIDKFQLIDFTRGKTATKGRNGLGCPVMIRDHEVMPQQSAKFLGIIVDS